MTTTSLPRTDQQIGNARRARLSRALESAWRSPFFARKLEAAGVRRGEVPSSDVWQRIEPTRKDELRGFSAQLECSPSADADGVVALVARDISSAFEVQPDIAVLERGTVAKRLESQVKQVRFRDQRAQDR